ncbi:hypothetical protein [Streptomyces sp. NPDC006739]|uniref:hypothetical protein n=1 Tax=Streptomyces sp. NPDC006739 TaxID=3364763 RepID=UPI0036BDAC08
MVVQDDPLSYWIVLLDIEDFSLRPETTQATLHDALYQVVEFALARAGLEAGGYEAQDRGDGMLLLLPAGTGPTRLLRELVRGLDDALVRHRDTYNHEHRMRLRVGLNQGLVIRSGQRWTGTGINDVARLVDAGPVKEVLARAGRAQLVLVVSDELHRQVVLGRYPGIDPAAYLPADFVTKHGETRRGWVTVPGYPAPPGLPVGSGEPPRVAGRSADLPGTGGTTGTAGGGTEPGSPVPPHAPRPLGTRAGGDRPGTYAAGDQIGTYVGGDQIGTYVGGDQIGTYVAGDYVNGDYVNGDKIIGGKADGPRAAHRPGATPADGS